jgi:MFS family permease
MVLASCAAAGFTSLLDNSALNVALPSLRRSLGADAHQVEWIVAGYSLTFALALVPGGRMGDTRGRRPLFLTGMAVFVCAGVVAGASGGVSLLIACRLLQGTGAGLVNGQVIGIIQDSFIGLARVRALGLYTTATGVGSVLGPGLGGMLVTAAHPNLGWRLVLGLSVPFGTGALILAGYHLHPAPTRGLQGKADVLGTLLFAGLTFAVLLPLLTPMSGLSLTWCAAIAGVLIVLFGSQQRHTSRAGGAPLLDPDLLRHIPYLMGAAVAATQFGAQTAASLALAMFVQDGLGLSALFAATVMLPMALAMAITSGLAGRAAGRFGPRAVTTGITLSVCALSGAGIATHYASPRVLPFSLAAVELIYGAAAGLLTAPLQAQVLSYAPARTAGVAGGILQMVQRLAAAACAAAVAGLYLHAGPHTLAGHRSAFGRAAVACACLTGLGLAFQLTYQPHRTRSRDWTG